MENYLAIDPDTIKLAGAFYVNSILTSVINYNSYSAGDYVRYLKRFVKAFNVQRLHVEDQKIYSLQTSEGVHSLINHVHFIRGYFYYYKRINGDKFFNLVSVKDWKGSLSKRLTKKRILKKLRPEEERVLVHTRTSIRVKDVKKLNNDCMDAIGVGLHVAGRF